MNLFEQIKDTNFAKKLASFLSRKPQEKKYTQKEVVLNWLESNPNDWFYVWELMGNKPLGFVSHKVDCALSELTREGKVEVMYIGKYAVYSIK